MATYLWLFLLGLAVGAFGTLIGAGGGFILMPILLLCYPEESPALLTSMSLAVVFFNAFSGSFAYARMKRIDYRAGLTFALASLPGAVGGALVVQYLPRRLFDPIFGGLLIAAAAFLIIAPDKKRDASKSHNRHGVHRTLTEEDGTVHSYTYDPRIGIALSILVGFFSSLFGIGGGIIHVPILVHLLDFPVHVATATSHFILAIMALAGTIVHISTGVFHHGVHRTMALALGVLIGAQAGALFSKRLESAWILRALAIALGSVGLRLLFAHNGRG